MTRIPPCEKCGGVLTADLKCERCRREYTMLWVRMTLDGKR